MLVDGQSGSGKTTLARELARELGAKLVHLDAIYPGWGGLEVGSAMVRTNILDPENPGWRRWDWNTRGPAEWHKLKPRKALVVEGSGALSKANRELATFAVWIELDQAERKRRALARDGPGYLDRWDRWAAQEHAFYARERPDLLADVILDNRSGRLITP